MENTDAAARATSATLDHLRAVTSSRLQVSTSTAEHLSYHAGPEIRNTGSPVASGVLPPIPAHLWLGEVKTKID